LSFRQQQQQQDHIMLLKYNKMTIEFQFFINYIPVCPARARHIHAGQVPAGLHVPAPRPHQSRTSLHVHPVALSGWIMYHQGDSVHLYHLPPHGLNITLY